MPIRVCGRWSCAPCGQVVSWVLWVALVLCFTALPAMAAPEGSAEPRQIIFGGDHDYEPYEWLDERGRPVGYHVDLMRAIGQVMGFEVTFQLGPWDQVRKALEEGRIDVLAMFYSAERDHLLDFSDPHTILYHEVFIRRDGPGISSLDDLRGREVIVQRGALPHDYLREQSLGAQLVLVETEPEAMRLLASGKHDCAIVTQLGGRLAMQQHNLSNLMTTGPPVLPRDYCLAVTEGNTALLKQLNEGLAILKATGRYNELHEKWFGRPIGVSLGVVLRYAVWVLVPLAMIAAAAAAWSWSLRKQVGERTRELHAELTERRRAEARIDHLNAVLSAIRAVNELIVREQDRDRLLQGACDRLVSTRGYRGAWIALLDQAGEFVAAARAGSGDHSSGVVEMLHRGEFPECAKRSLSEGGLVVSGDVSACPCPLATAESGWAGASIPLECQGRTYGVVSVELPAELATDEEEQGLLSEAANDLAFAFYSLELEGERRQAEEDLRESERQHRLLAENVTDVIWTMDMGQRFTYFSPSVTRLRGYSVEEARAQTLAEAMTPASYEKAVAVIAEELALEGGADVDLSRSRRLELEMTRKDGSTVWVGVHATFLRDEEGTAIGILGVARDISERKRAEQDLQRTLEQLRESLGGTIQVVTSTVEVRDPYTAGHQRRVTDLARAIAKEMQVPQERIDAIRMAGAIHDLGKVSVPAEILSKPGPLTDAEFRLVKTHPQVGHDILKNVEFPWPVAQIVLQHHERMDGSGYPAGLVGEEILLEARILAVADVVEAMASHRPYRPARGIDEALAEISQKRGALYDPEVVDACVTLFADKRFAFK